MDWNKIFDEAKKRLMITSDYALAKKLEVTDGGMSHYRKGNRSPDPDVAWKLADINNVNPLLYIAAAECERTNSEKKREVWQGRLGKLHSTVARVFLIAAVSGATAMQSENALSKEQASSFTSYTLCNVRRWLQRWLYSVACRFIPTGYPSPT